MTITSIKLPSGKTLYIAEEKSKLHHIKLSGYTRALAIGRVLKELTRDY